MKNSYALIIGGTEGLGAALALELNKCGIWTVVAGRSALHTAVAKKFPYPIRRIMLDVTDPATYQNLVVLKELPHPLSYVFWVSGVFKRKSFLATSWVELDSIVQTNFLGGLKVLHRVDELIPRGQPYHLAVVASTSSWRLRKHEAVYCASKAAQAAFTRNFVRELTEARPGSSVTLINPGGVRTNLYAETDQDTSIYLDPATVAGIIGDEVLLRTTEYREMNILRANDKGAPNVVYGPILNEDPSL